MYKYTRFVGRSICYRNVIRFSETRRKISSPKKETKIERSIHLAAYSTLKCKNDSNSREFKHSDRRKASSVPGTNLNGSTEAKPVENSVDCDHPQMQQIVDEINRNYRVMICMRGAPGSGKSHLARTIVDRTVNGASYNEHIFSTDDYFYDQQTKQYNYDRSQLRQAHDVNKWRVAQRAADGWSPIIVDNTNMKLWEMFPYVKEGIRHGYAIRILEPRTAWAKSVDELVLRNKHKVNRETIQRMLSIYEPGNVADLLNALHLRPARHTLRKFSRIQEPNEDGN